jgi:hypothetical protein
MNPLHQLQRSKLSTMKRDYLSNKSSTSESESDSHSVTKPHIKATVMYQKSWDTHQNTAKTRLFRPPRKIIYSFQNSTYWNQKNTGRLEVSRNRVKWHSSGFWQRHSGVLFEDTNCRRNSLIKRPRRGQIKNSIEQESSEDLVGALISSPFTAVVRVLEQWFSTGILTAHSRCQSVRKRTVLGGYKLLAKNFHICMEVWCPALFRALCFGRCPTIFDT